MQVEREDTFMSKSDKTNKKSVQTDDQKTEIISEETVEKRSDEIISKVESNAEFRKLPFIEKCKRDPMIPVSILLAFLAVIVAAIYFILPDAKTPSMGVGLSEFVNNFNNGAVAASLMESGADIGFRTPPYVDPDSKPSMLGDKAVYTASRSYADFFAGPSKYFINAGIEGATRKSDNNVSYLRIWVQYSDMSDDADFNTVWLYFANTLNALYPEMSSYEAMGISMKRMGEYDGNPGFYVRGDYGFRLVPVLKDDITYIVIDVVPKSVLKESQIREVLEVTSTDASAEPVTDESAASSEASD